MIDWLLGQVNSTNMQTPEGENVFFELGNASFPFLIKNPRTVLSRTVKLFGKTSVLTLLHRPSGLINYNNPDSRITARTPTSGRSEYIEITLEELKFISPEILDKVLNNLGIDYSKDYKIMIVLKGTGPGQVFNEMANIMDTTKTHSFLGFSGIDQVEWDLAKIGKIFIEEMPNYWYTPTRLIVCAIPINKIFTSKQERDLTLLPEQPMIEIILELGGINFHDLVLIAQNNPNPFLKEKLKKYFLYIFKNHFYLKQFAHLTEWEDILKHLLVKYLFDSIIESKLWKCGKNRSLQNMCITGFKDLDDAILNKLFLTSNIDLNEASESFSIKLANLIFLFKEFDLTSSINFEKMLIMFTNEALLYPRVNKNMIILLILKFLKSYIPTDTFYTKFISNNGLLELIEILLTHFNPQQTKYAAEINTEVNNLIENFKLARNLLDQLSPNESDKNERKQTTNSNISDKINKDNLFTYKRLLEIKELLNSYQFSNKD